MQTIGFMLGIIITIEYGCVLTGGVLVRLILPKGWLGYKEVVVWSALGGIVLLTVDCLAPTNNLIDCIIMNVLWTCDAARSCKMLSNHRGGDWTMRREHLMIRSMNIVRGAGLLVFYFAYSS